MNDITELYLNKLLKEAEDDYDTDQEQEDDETNLNKEDNEDQSTDNDQSENYEDDTQSQDDGDYQQNDQQMGEEGFADGIDIGKIYSLKKIYARLISINNLLSYYSEDWTYDAKQKIEEVIEIFKIIISNLNDYKDKVDDIIVKYGKFIKNFLIYINSKMFKATD